MGRLMMARKVSVGALIRRLLFMIIGGLLGLALAAFLLLGPLNPKPQVAFDVATGFLALFFTAFLGWAGMELGIWVAHDAEVGEAMKRQPTPDPHQPDAAA